MSSIWNIFLLLLISWIKCVISQFPNCDYSMKVDPGRTYEISSPNFARGMLYPAGTMCRWDAEAPPGYRVNIYCDYFEIPSSAQCVNDKFVISRRGRTNLSDGQRYCGYGPISFQSLSSRAVFSLQADRNSRGGRLRCFVSTIVDDCTCGMRNRPRIVGGNQTLVNEYPMMAGLVDAQLRRIFCGATIITNTVALTAAHCLVGKNISLLSLLVGDHDISTGSETPYSALYRIVRMVQHQQFSERTLAHDIALVWTERAMIFNRGVGVSCLPYKFRGNSLVGSQVIAAGWGLDDFGGRPSNVLKHVYLKVVSSNHCSATQLCTFADGKDTCQNDSGGPIFYIDQNFLIHVVGIISEGFGCATEYPGINTRITPYLDWIEYYTPETVFCIR